MRTYQLAKSRNYHALNNHLKDHFINEVAPGVVNTAISKLAEENEIYAVEFLLIRGANIGDAIEGAARGGHRDFAKELYARSGDDKNFTKARKFAFGAGQGGRLDIEEVKCIIGDRGIGDYEFIEGAAVRGDRNYLLALNEGDLPWSRIAKHAAKGGHREMVYESIPLISERILSRFKIETYSEIIGYAVIWWP